MGNFSVDGYLVIEATKPSYSSYYTGKLVKVTKAKPSLTNRQIAIAINVKVPNAFFERLTPVIKIELPEGAVVNPDVQAVIDLSAIEIADKLNLEITAVKDGLREMIEAKKKEHDRT